MQIAKDRVVTLDYQLYTGEELVDSSEENGPLVFLQGHAQVVPGLESQIDGLSVGDQRTVEVTAEQGFGEYDDEATEKISREDFPSDITPEPGMELYMSHDPEQDDETNGEPDEDDEILVCIREVTDEHVVIDFNHPLAGKALRFEVTVVDVREATDMELEHGHAHGEDGTDTEMDG